MDDFHFLRPAWLLVAPLVAALAWLTWRRLTRSDAWLAGCDEHLLRFLRERPVSGLSRAPFVLFGSLGCLMTIALAGPAWDAAEASVHRTMRARVVALDLSRSMDATDIEPSRMAVARRKAAEVFRRTTDDQVGLIVFAGDGFYIAPLSSDPSSLIGILPAFSPGVITAQGSRADLGLGEAGWLVRRAGAAGGEIVLITDGATGRKAVDVARRLWENGIRVSVLAVGTEAGARIPLEGTRYLRDFSGQEIVARTEMGTLSAIAAAGGGRFTQVTADNTDVEYLLAASGLDGKEGAVHDAGAILRIWLDRGPWFVVLLLPLAALSFRRGWLFAATFALVLPWSPARESVASPGDAGPPAAIERPADPAVDAASAARPDSGDWRWQAVDLYRAGRYVQAAALFGEGERAADHYNRGNALAKAGFYQAAVAAYQEAIRRDEDNADARFNRALVESLMDQEREQARGSGRGGGPGQPAGDAETSGSGDTDGQDRGNSTGAQPGGNDTQDGVDTGPGAAQGQSDGSGQGSPANVSAEQMARGQAESESQRVQAVGANPESARLTGAEMSRLEQAVDNIAERRLGLWRRKIEQQWRNNPRRGLTQTDAW